MHPAVPNMSLLSDLKKSASGKQVLHSLAFRLTGLAVIFGMQVLLARLMGAQQYGNYIVIITTLNVLLVGGVFGFDSSVLRFLPSYLAKKDYKSAYGFVKFSYRMVLIFASACSVALFIFLLARAKKYGSTVSEGYFWGIILIPVLALLYQASAILRALQKYKTSLIPVFFMLPFTIGTVSYYYFRIYHKLNVDAAMLINLSCTIVVCIYTMRRTKRTTGFFETDERKTLPREWMPVSAILFLTTALDLLLRQSDILMVSYFLGNTEAGYYAVAARLATLTALGLSVADYVFMPKIAALYEGRQLVRLQDLVKNASLQILSITLPVVFVLFIGGKWILGMFGEQFENSYPVLVILLCGQIINSFTGMVGGLMTMTGHQRTFLVFYFMAFVIQFVLNMIFIRSFGMIGAAIGTSIAMIVLNLLAYTFVKKKLKIKASFY